MQTEIIKKALNEAINGNKTEKIDIGQIDPELSEIAESINTLIEDKNKESDEKEFLYNTLMKVPMPMALMDSALNIVDINEDFSELTGYSKERMTKLNLSDFHREFNLEHIEGRGTKDALETKEKVSGKFHMVFKGAEKIIEISSIPLINERGIITNVNTVLVDITEIENQKVWYESILDAIPFPVSVTDLNMNWTYLNPATAGMAKVDPKEAVGTQCSRWNANICKTRECGVECLRRGQDKTYFEQDGGNFMVNAAWIKNARGENIGHVEIIQDVTEAENLKKDAENLAAWYESILDAIPFPVSVTDLNMNWTYLNPVTAKMANVDKKEAIGTQCNRWNANICRTSNCGVECLRRGQEKTFFEQDGGNYMVDVAWVRDGTGEKVGHVEVIQDVTATTKVGEYLKQEVANVAADLEAIAGGRPQDIRLQVGEADQYTKEVREQFIEITSSVKSVNDSFMKLVEDIESLVDAGEEGKLNFKADSSKYEGAYTGLVDGMNNLLMAASVPVYETLKVCDSFADADFTARFSDDIKVKGDFLKLKEALNNIGINVSDNVKNSVEITKQITNNSDEVGKGTDEVAKAAEAVANTSQNAADLTKELMINIEDINRQIADLSASNEEIASTSQEVFNAANHVVEIGKEAQGLGNDANDKMNNVEKIAKESVVEINDLTGKVKEVSNVVKLINDITGQINLLALNAAIEAARAGEHGRGFAVVAGEVKNLAAEARAAADSIGSVVSMVQTSSEKTAGAINNANAEIVDGVGSVTKALEALNTIIKNAGQVTTDIGEITKAIEDQANISNNVVKSVDSGTEKTKEVQKEAEELAALAEEASASVEEIGSAIHEVNALVKDLDTANARFKY